MECPQCNRQVEDGEILKCSHCGFDFGGKTILKSNETADTVGKTVIEQTVQKTWKSVLGTEDIGQTIKEPAQEVRMPSQANVRTQSVTNTQQGPVTPPPDYELIDQIGEGGMGVIYSARQSSVDRVVAVKMTKGSGDQRSKDLFLAEAVATGNLDHPNIVPIYDLGSNPHGDLFYSMKNVKGVSWKDVIRKKSRPENLEIMLRVCDAVAFAHSRGVIHRDLKPENIMLGDFGEVYVMDWGLAASVSEDGKAQPLSENTAAGGTPAYMAPEMGSGDEEHIGIQSDVYLLGAILFEIITGKRPHTGTNIINCLHSVIANKIVETNIKGELIDIALKALSTAPEDRFQSVKEFQNAIREYQTHSESIRLTEEAQTTLEQAGDNYEMYARAVFAFEEAVKTWKENKAASKGIVRARYAYAQCAFGHDDFDLAKSLLYEAIPDHQTMLKQIREAQHRRHAREKRMKVLTRGVFLLVCLIAAIVTGAFFWIRSEQRKTLVEKQKALQAKEAAEMAEKGETEHKERAQKALSDLRLLSKKVAPKFYKEALGFQETEKWDRAMEAVNTAVGLDPDFEKAWLVKGELHLGRAEPELAAAALEKAGTEDKKGLLTVAKKLSKADKHADGRLLPAGKHKLHLELQKAEAFVMVNQLMKDKERMGSLEKIAYLKNRFKIIQKAMIRLNPKIRKDYFPGGVSSKGYMLEVSLHASTHNGYGELRDISPLQGMPLTKLGLYSTRVIDISPLKGMPLKELQLEKCKVSDISALEGMPLEILELGRTDVSDLSPLQGMPLTKLRLYSTRVIDISPLKGMPLVFLTISNTDVSDLSALKDMPLTDLNLGNCKKVSDISSLQNMPLKKLFLSATKVKDLSVLKGMPLEILSIPETVTDLSPLKGLKLKELSFQHYKKSDISVLKGMPLIYLNLSYARKLSDISALRGMALKSLSLVGTGVTDISILKNMPLENLSIDGTKVTEISALQGMQLKFIDLRGIKVVDLSVLKGMPLKHIRINLQSGVGDTGFLRKMPTLKRINDRPAAQFWEEYDSKKKQAELPD